MNRLRDLFTCMLLVGLGAGMGAGTVAAWSDDADNTGNRIKAGTVVLTNDAGGSAVYPVGAATPGTAMNRCVVVSYDGTLRARVKLFGSVSGGLAPHLTLEVVRGTKAPAADGDCTGFAPDTADHAGLGAGVLWRGPLDTFPGSGAAIVDPQSWGEGDDHAYQFRLTMSSAEAAQGLSATMSFTWEAENL
jgi:predicted ribosomally synthesized peptide with SipW-like signal peptide